MMTATPFNAYNATARKISYDGTYLWTTQEVGPSVKVSSHFIEAIALAFLTCGVISTIGNIMLVYSFYRMERLRKLPANILTIHLAVNNAFLGLMAIRYGVKIFRRIGAEDVISCPAEGFMLSTVHMNIMTTIAAMFGERYVVICLSKARGSCLSFCHHRPVWVIALIWFHSAFWAFWPLTSVVPDYVIETVMPCCIFDRKTASPINILYLSTMSLSAFIFPLIFICYALTRIFDDVKKSSDNVRMRRVFVKPRAQNEKAERTNLQKEKIKTSQLLLGQEHVTETRPMCGALIKTTDQYRGSRPLPAIVSTTLTDGGVSYHRSRVKAKKYSPEQAVVRSAVVLVTTFSVSWTPFLLVCILNLSGVTVDSHIVLLTYAISKASCIHSSYAYATHNHYKATIRYITCRGRRRR